MGGRREEKERGKEEGKERLEEESGIKPSGSTVLGPPVENRVAPSPPLLASILFSLPGGRLLNGPAGGNREN